jgi:RNA polymerase sigma factor (sigma-70 family)
MLSTVPNDSLAAERAMLVRFCTSYTRRPDVAEDLAQLTLLDAWRHDGDLRDPQARSSWLLSIARNRCRMWARQRQPLTDVDEVDPGDLFDERFDLEVELERDELAGLLDRALALLPPETRDLLVRRYIDELPQAEIARVLSLSEGAVEGRLHRGKLALRRVLSTTLGDAAASLGLIDARDAGWTPTPIWCPACGVRKVEARMDTVASTLVVRCAECDTAHPDLINSTGFVSPEARTVRPAVSRVLVGIDEMFRHATVDGHYRCTRCGRSLPLREISDGVFVIECTTCDWIDRETWHSLTWSVPEVRAFWREYARSRFRPAHEIEYGGVRAVVTGFESVSDSSAIEVVTRRDTLQVLHVARTSAR